MPAFHCYPGTMSQTVLVTLLGGGLTILCGLLVAWVSHWLSGRQVKAAQCDQRLQELRIPIAEFVNAGRALAESHELLVPVYQRSGTDPEFQTEWPETDTGRSQFENSVKIDRLVGELRLIVSDPVLLERITKAYELKSDTAPMGELLASNSGETALIGAFRHYKAMAAAFDAVEARAAELLRGEIQRR